MASTVSWMQQQLESKCNTTMTKGICHIRSSHLGTIFEPTQLPARVFFLKYTSSFANDAAYTQALGENVPDFVALPVTVDVEKHMMLTADHGRNLSPWDLPDTDINRLTRNYVQLQIATMGRGEELVSVGMSEMRIPKLLEHVDRLAGCSVFQSLGNCERSQKDVELFCRDIERFKAEINKLERRELPATVTHNDLTTSNIYKPDGKEDYTFFDFVEGHVSRPFVLWLHSLDEESYLREWCAWPGARDELSKMLYIGGTCHLLALMTLHPEVQDAAFPKCDEHFESVRSSLRKFNYSSTK